MRPANRRRPLTSHGMSLIEVIVALVVISGFGAALFVWAGQTLQTANRAAELQRETELERNITELAASLNPFERPSGELQTRTHRFAWTATLRRGPTDQAAHPVGRTAYQVAVYSVRFTVTDRDNPGPALVSERQVAGYKQVRGRITNSTGFGGGTVTPAPSTITP